MKSFIFASCRVKPQYKNYFMCVDKAKERENQADVRTHRNSPLKQHDIKIEESKIQEWQKAYADTY